MGVASEAKILSIRAVTDQGDPGYHHYQHESESRVQGHLADAINYATSKRVNVISMSLGYQGASLPVRVAISKALAQGIVVVASSGNSGGASSGSHGNAPYSFPADYPGVLGVGAVAQNGLPAGFSSANLSVQVAAPGVRVPAQGRDGQYWLVSGTSPACALTAGVAALIKSVYPTLAPALVVQAITASTGDKPHGGYDEEVGFGTVDATAALRMAGRLARNQGSGPGKVAATLFGGGPAAIPPVPVAPRTNRQFLLDSGIALICLAVVLVVAFRLVVTRKPAGALAGAPSGWAGPGAPSGWTGSGPPDPRAPGGWAGGGPADAPVPGGWAGRGPAESPAPGGWATRGGAADAPVPGGWATRGGPSGSGASGGWAGGAPPAVGPSDVASGADGAGSDGDATGYGRPGRYWATGGYKPSAGYPSPSGYGSSEGVQPHADPGSPRPPMGYGQPRAPEPPVGYGPPTGNGLAAGYGPPTSPALPGAPEAPGIPGAFGALTGGSPGANTGPVAGFGEPAEPQDLLDSQTGAPPAADDDTWPSSGRW